MKPNSNEPMMDDESLNDERVAELLSFLPFFEKSQGKKVIKWLGGEKTEDGSTVWPFPDYPNEVILFFKVASQPWWSRSYLGIKLWPLLEAGLEGIDMNTAKSVLTCFARGERFCDGLWVDLVESGALVLLLKKIGQLWSEKKDQ